MTTPSTKAPSKLYVKSNWSPPPGDIPPNIDDHIDLFCKKLNAIFKRQAATPNLLPFQEDILRSLHWDPNSCSLILRPLCCHLRPIHQWLPNPPNQYYDIYTTHTMWSPLTFRHNALHNPRLGTKAPPHLDKLDSKYIIQHMANNKKNPFGQFYGTYKIHKGQKDNRWPTRLVCSDVSSITYGLGKWVDQMLQPIAAAQHSYLKDSFALKEMIWKLHLPPNALLFTCNAKSIYTNIPTETALTIISQ